MKQRKELLLGVKVLVGFRGCGCDGAADMCNFARFNLERLLADASTSGTVFLAS